MMDQQKGDFVFCCDVCGTTLQTGTGNFEAARNRLRREGWKPVKARADEWQHYCDACQRAEGAS